MTKFYAIMFILIGIIFNTTLAQPTISVIYPHEDQIITSSDSAFIFGHVQPASAILTINDQVIPLYSNGSFLAFLPIRSGLFTFHCMAATHADTVHVERNIQVPSLFSVCTSESLVVDSSSIYPQKDWILHEGDIFRVSFKGTPACTALFTIDGVRENIPMVESPVEHDSYWGNLVFGQSELIQNKQIAGIYSGAYWIQPGDWRENRKIHFSLIDADGDTLHFDAPGRLTIQDTSIPIVAEVTSELSVLRTEPWKGYHLFLPSGVRLWLTGRHGDVYRVRLTESESAWVPESDIHILPAGTSPPMGIVKLERATDMGKKLRVTVFTGIRVPFRIVQRSNPSSLEIFFYGIISDTDWIRNDFKSKLLGDMRWEQVSDLVYHLSIALNQEQQWGYSAFYDDNDQFNIDIKKAPHISGWPHSPLKGIAIVLDPGHGPDLGAVGPSGLAEKDANLMLALVLKKHLESKGAFVELTREGEQGIGLQARPQVASIIDPDLLLSLHHNALPDGVNPFLNHGTSTYYYHPQSYKLAVLIQENLLKKLGLPNYGLFYDNLLLCRPTNMPAILVEPAFIMHPAEEMLISTEAYRNDVSDAIVQALEDFLKQTKE